MTQLKNTFRDKTLMKTLTKTLKVKTPKTYTKTFFTNCILKNNSVRIAFYTTVKNLRGESKQQWKA